MSTPVSQPKFRYYITDTLEGEVVATNDLEIAMSCAVSTDYFVVDALTGMWIMEDGEKTDIKELK